MTASTILLRALPGALATMLAALATLACALAIDREPAPAVLGVVLCLSLARSELARDARGRIEAALALPLVGLSALGVGWLLQRQPPAGAALYVAAIALSIWLRRFGTAGRKAGALIALPFVVLLVTPHMPAARVGPALALALPVIVALLALFWVSVFQAAATRLGWREPAQAAPHVAAAAAPASGLRPAASTRMAVQMAVALAAAFVVGDVFFPERWAWLVLTAFIVGSGNHGRLDVVHKSVLRVLGAGAGTAIALAAAHGLGAPDGRTAALILAAVFLALWLRPLGYAWWALFITLALALLQGFEGGAGTHGLGQRLAEIVIGALIGIAAAWFVLPVRSTDVLRRRLADALAALALALDPATPARSAAPFLAALDGVDRLAPAFRSARLATRRWRRDPPAGWIDDLLGCRAAAVALIAAGATPGPVRQAVGAARKSLREPATIAPSLARLRAVLDATVDD